MQNNKVYVGNLDYSVTLEQLKGLFETYGEVSQANIVKGKGFGFIIFENDAQAMKAREALDGSDFIGRSLRVDLARPKQSPAADSIKLYVGNISYTVEQLELHRLFNQFGRVRRINIIKGRGFGFVEYGSKDEAAEARKALDGEDFMGRNLRVDFALSAQDKDDEERAGAEDSEEPAVKRF